MKARKPNKLPPFCFGCEAKGAVWKSEMQVVDQEFRGETFHVPAEITVCRHCGFCLAHDGQADEIARATREAYRMKHGLLTSVEIVARREKMSMSQQQFADMLGVGVASVKRWERGCVQDRSKDELIRAKTAAREELILDLLHGYISGVVHRQGKIGEKDLIARLVEYSEHHWRGGGLDEVSTANVFLQARAYQFIANVLQAKGQKRRRDVVVENAPFTLEFADFVLCAKHHGQVATHTQRWMRETVVPNRGWTLNVSRRGQLHSTEESSAIELTA